MNAVNDPEHLLTLIANYGAMEFNAGYGADRGDDNLAAKRAAARAFRKI